jgi:hypothetical protein
VLDRLGIDDFDEALEREDELRAAGVASMFDAFDALTEWEHGPDRYAMALRD